MNRQLHEAETMPAPAENVPPVDTTDHAVGKIEIAISVLLRTGVISSISIIILGMAIGYFRHPDYVRDTSQLTRLTAKNVAFPHSLREVIRGTGELSSQAIIAAGLLLLIATPVMRVAISIVAFAVQKDRLFVMITITVLMLLIVSFLFGHASE